MFCTECGNKYSQGSQYCSRCGTSIANLNKEVRLSLEKVVSKVENEAPLSGSQQYDPATQVRPWVRYWARMFDIYLYVFPAGFILGFMFPELLITEGGEYVFGMILLFSWVFVEALCLCVFETTPGKSLFRIRMQPASGQGFSYGKAFSRSWKVWFRGMGVGFPLITFVTLLVGYSKLKQNGRTSWDIEEGIIVRHEVVGIYRTVFAVIAFFIYFMMISVVSAL